MKGAATVMKYWHDIGWLQHNVELQYTMINMECQNKIACCTNVASQEYFNNVL